MIPHHTYRTRHDVAAMVRKAEPREGAYDTEAIVDYLWQMVDEETGRLDVNVGTFWALYDLNRLDTPQLRAVEAIIRMIETTTHGNLMSVEYSRPGDGNPVLTAIMDADDDKSQYRVDVSDTDDNAPIVEIHEVIRTGDYVDPKEDLNQIMRTTDLAQGMAKLTEIAA